MTAILWTFLEPVLPYLSAGLLLVFGIIGAFLRGKSSGKATERAKQAERDFNARTEADKIDDAIAGRSPSTNRAELKKWSKS